MKVRCPYCQKKIWGQVYPNQKWLGLDLYPRKDKGVCPHCHKSVIFSKRYLYLHFIGWFCFAIAVPLPFFFPNTIIGSFGFRLIFSVFFVIFVSASFCVSMYAKKIT